MYKVFFNERTVFLTQDILRSFRENNGLFYKFREKKELKELLFLFNALKKIDQLFICHHDTEKLFDEFRSCFRFVEAAGGLVRNRAGKVLFIYRLDRWDLPKGKSEGDETAHDTAIREVEEECGISGLKILSELEPTLHTYFEAGIYYLKKTRWFEMYYGGSEKLRPQQDELITDIIWAGEEDLDRITKNTYPSIILLLKETKII